MTFSHQYLTQIILELSRVIPCVQISFLSAIVFEFGMMHFVSHLFPYNFIPYPIATIYPKYKPFRIIYGLGLVRHIF